MNFCYRTGSCCGSEISASFFSSWAERGNVGTPTGTSILSASKHHNNSNSHSLSIHSLHSRNNFSRFPLSPLQPLSPLRRSPRLVDKFGHHENLKLSVLGTLGRTFQSCERLHDRFEPLTGLFHPICRPRSWLLLANLQSEEDSDKIHSDLILILLWLPQTAQLLILDG